MAEQLLHDALQRAKELPTIRLSDRAICDLELLATGAFSPLDRFMGAADYARVLEEMRLASGPLFTALRIVGAAYLVFFGAEALLAAWRGRSADSARPRRRATYRQGLLSNLGNPKIAVFFTSLLPQFGDSFWSLLAHGLLFCSLGLVWLSAYSFAVARAGDVLRRPRIRRSQPARRSQPGEK